MIAIEKLKVLFLILFGCMASSCITIKLSSDEKAVPPEHPIAFQGVNWQAEEQEEAYQTYRYREDNIQVIVSPSCSQDSGGMSYKQRAHLLASALDNGVVTAESRFDQGKMHGWRLQAKGTFDEAPIEMTVQVMDNGECIYDLILISPHLSDNVIAEFEGAIRPGDAEEVSLAH